MKSTDPTKPAGLLVLPRSLVPATLEAFHNKTAHPGAASTSENIRRIYTGGQISTKIWPTTRAILRNLCHDKAQSTPSSPTGPANWHCRSSLWETWRGPYRTVRPLYMREQILPSGPLPLLEIHSIRTAAQQRSTNSTRTHVVTSWFENSHSLLTEAQSL